VRLRWKIHEHAFGSMRSEMHAARRLWGAYASSRVLFGVPPNWVFRRDAGNCTRGRVRPPDIDRRGFYVKSLTACSGHDQEWRRIETFLYKQALALMPKSIVGIAKTNLQVERTIDELQEDAVIPISEISVLMPEAAGVPELGTVKATKAPEAAATGAITGGVVGGTLGLLAGIGTLAIPGLGPFIAAGPIVAALGGTAAGAAAGGVVGALVGLGIPEEEAKVYEARLKEGGYLVAVQVQDNEVADICRDIMKRNNLEDVTLVSER
jgi:uncharacterized membrane protein